MNLQCLTNRERIFQTNNAVLRSKQTTSLLKAESVKQTLSYNNKISFI